MSVWPVIVERQAPASRQGVAESSPVWGQAHSPLLARLLAARGASADSLDFSLSGLPDPAGLVSPAAVELLLAARHQRILVVADYDADGATACAVMVKGLRLLGFERVDFLVPDRFVDGYGLTPVIAARACEAGADLLITVDNGIASLDGVAAARAARLDVLITDHHLPGTSLPDCVIVNPRLQPEFAGRELAGVGVAFYVLLALRRALRDRGDVAGQANLATLLDLVALGTVADVVTLDRVNRLLVEQGLRRMRQGVASPGVLALAAVAKRDLARLTAADLGFALGPRLNAAGRLADMRHGIDCLLAGDEMEAAQLAEELDAINRDRRLIETGMQQEAEKQLVRLDLKGELPPVLCLYSADWHEGVVGLLASRIKEKCQRPVFAFADSQQAGWVKGSGRSIAGIHLRDLLAEVATLAPGLIDKFGGHAMAAGLTLTKENLPRLRDLLEQVALKRMTAELLTRKVMVDGRLDEAELTLANAEALTFGSPWGQGFPAPLFHGEFELLSQRLVAEKHLKLTLGLPQTSSVIDAIHFNADLSVWPKSGCARVEAIYRLESNSFRGQLSAQLLLEHVRAL